MADILLMVDESVEETEAEDAGIGVPEGEIWDGYRYGETLNPSANLERYAQADVFSRQMVPSILLDIFQEGPPDIVTQELPNLMDIVTRLANDTDVLVRADLVQRIPHIAAACAKFSARIPALSNVVVDHLLPLVVHYLGDAETQVRKYTHTAIITLMEQGYIPKSAIENKMCQEVLYFARPENLNDSWTEPITLISKMVPLLGKEITERLFLPRFVKLCKEPKFWIRMTCASSFGEFCATVGPEKYQSVLLPRFIDLCEDEVWKVRQACAEVIMPVSCACTTESRKSQLAPAYYLLLRDESRWVRLSALQNLGPFISTFANPSIIGLSYNQVGELVLVNPEGAEFRVNSLAPEDSSIKSRINFKAMLCDVSDKYKGFPQSRTLDTLYNSTLNQGDYHNDKSETNNATPKIVVNSDGSQDVTKPVRSNDAIDGCDNQPGTDSPSEQKIVHSDLNGSGDAVSSPKKMYGGSFEDDLEKFNPYQYWYINPELPLDPEIVEAGKPETKAEQENTFINRLADINFLNSSGLDTTIKVDNIVIAKTESPTKANLDLQSGSSLQDIVPQYLIEHFIDMANAKPEDEAECDIAYHCAFSLPAVALTLGRSNWYLLKDLCETLASNLQYKVRKTIACSLHELALILGQDLTVEYLVKIFDDFIKDLDEVRIGFLPHLAHFLKIISPKTRHLYLPRLVDFFKMDSPWKWRYREELAKQLLLALPLFQPSESAEYLTILAHELLCDKVAAVREVALSLNTELIRHVSDKKALSSKINAELVERFARSNYWVWRQAFILLCSRLISSSALPPEQFAEELLPQVLLLSRDSIPNVRLTVSKLIVRDIWPTEYFANVNTKEHNALHSVMLDLQADRDVDVSQFAFPQKPQ